MYVDWSCLIVSIRFSSHSDNNMPESRSPIRVHVFAVYSSSSDLGPLCVFTDIDRLAAIRQARRFINACKRLRSGDQLSVYETELETVIDSHQAALPTESLVNH